MDVDQEIAEMWRLMGEQSWSESDWGHALCLLVRWIGEPANSIPLAQYRRAITRLHDAVSNISRKSTRGG